MSNNSLFGGQSLRSHHESAGLVSWLAGPGLAAASVGLSFKEYCFQSDESNKYTIARNWSNQNSSQKI